jgi:hypothetical protein
MTSLVSALIRGDLRRMMADEVQSAARALRRGVTRATQQVQSDLRAQARGAGFKDGGRAVANAWRMQVYPAVGIETLHPAGVVWTKAPAITEAFDRGVPITARRHRFLAFPTGYNAAGGRRSAGSRGGLRVTPAQMLTARGQAFILRSKSNPSVWLWCLRIAEGRGLSRRGRNRIRLYVGSSTEVLTGRHRGRNQRAGELLQQGFLPMFFLVRQVTPGKRLDIAAVRLRARDLLAHALAAELARP